MDFPRCCVLSPAKVNLGLRILGSRSDGYHAIQTVLQMLDLCDRLTFCATREARIILSCNTPTLPTDDGNLVVRAAKLLQHRMRVSMGANITLEKSIPMAAGLGGGSSNAAITLLALNRVWQLNCPPTVLHTLATELGSDVPFFLSSPTAVAEGRGEVLSALPPPPALQGILLNPGFGVSAGWAYRQFNGRSSATDATIPEVWRAFNGHDFAALAAAMVNDLEPGVTAVYPIIREMQEVLRAVGAQVTFMSGSGPTVGGFFGSSATLTDALTVLRTHAAWMALPFSTLSESLNPELQG